MGGILTTLGIQLPQQQLNDMQKKIDKLEKANAISRETNETLRRKIAEMTTAAEQMSATTEDATIVQQKLDKVIAAHEETKRALRKAEVELTKRTELHEKQKQTFLKDIESLRADYEAFEAKCREKVLVLQEKNKKLLERHLSLAQGYKVLAHKYEELKRDKKTQEAATVAQTKPKPVGLLPIKVPIAIKRPLKRTFIKGAFIKGTLPVNIQNVNKESKTVSFTMNQRFLRIEIEHVDIKAPATAFIRVERKPQVGQNSFPFVIRFSGNNELTVFGNEFLQGARWKQKTLQGFKSQKTYFKPVTFTRELKTLAGGRKVNTVVMTFACSEGIPSCNGQVIFHVSPDNGWQGLNHIRISQSD